MDTGRSVAIGPFCFDKFTELVIGPEFLFREGSAEGQPGLPSSPPVIKCKNHICYAPLQTNRYKNIKLIGKAVEQPDCLSTLAPAGDMPELGPAPGPYGRYK